jgi:hypothetical protein
MRCNRLLLIAIMAEVAAALLAGCSQGAAPTPAPDGFPTTPILDTCNRANENPLSDGGKWTVTEGTMVVSSGQCMNTAEGMAGVAYWNVFTVARNFEVYAAVAAVPSPTSDSVSVFVLQTGTSNGYGFACLASTGLCQVLRSDTGTTTVLTSHTYTLVNGDGIGLRSMGDTLYGYIQHDGVWGQVASTSDSTYTTGFNLTIIPDGTVTGMTNIGGGSN